MDLALDELLSDFHSYQPLPQEESQEEGERVLNQHINKDLPDSSSFLNSLSPPPPPKSPIHDEEHDIILPPPLDFQDDEDPSSPLLLQALTPKSLKHKSTTDLLINEINELSELLPWKGEAPPPLALSNPPSPHFAQPTQVKPIGHQISGNSRLCIISKRDETTEHDSGIESIESLSPKEFDFSPACSPAGPKNNVASSASSSSTSSSSSSSSYLSSLLSTPPETTNSGIILSSLLNHSTTSELVYSIGDPTPTIHQPPSNTSIPTFLLTKDVFNSAETGVEDRGPSAGSCWVGETESSMQETRLSNTLSSTPKSGAAIRPKLSSWNCSTNGTKFEARDLKSDVPAPCIYSKSSQSRNKSFDSVVGSSGGKGTKRNSHNKDFYCDKCKMSLGTLTKYEKHMKSHGRTKEFKCETCGKEFMIKKNLTLHYKLHSEQKSYNCSLCFKSYQSKSSCSAHMKLMHPSESQNLLLQNNKSNLYEPLQSSSSPGTTDSSSVASPLVEEGPKKEGKGKEGFNCQSCKKSFKSKKTLSKHLEKGSCSQSLDKCTTSSSSSWIPSSSDDLLQTIHSMELDQLLF